MTDCSGNRTARSLSAMFMAALVLLACSPDTTRTAVGPGGSDTTDPGGPPRATLAGQVAFEIADSAVVRLLGGAGAALRGVTVELRRRGDPSGFAATLDSTGRFQNTGLLEGTYDLEMLRVLSEPERQALAGSFPDVDAFVAAASIEIRAPTTNKLVTITVGRRGGLVISEVNIAKPYDATIGEQYRWSQYIEVYNNGDTTLYLDGLTIGFGFGASFDYPSFPCAAYAPVALDSLGIWTDYLWRFPGNGRSHALAPGAAAVLANDAIDHTSLASGAPDLRQARFEFTGGPDNPSVPDMIEFGTRRMSDNHGFHIFKTVPVIVLARQLELPQLSQRSQPLSESITLARIPAGALLDVTTIRVLEDSPYPACPGPLAARFERSVNERLDGSLDTRTLQRRVVYARNGQRILQRTGSSQADFDARTGTPGTLP